MHETAINCVQANVPLELLSASLLSTKIVDEGDDLVQRSETKPALITSTFRCAILENGKKVKCVHGTCEQSGDNELFNFKALESDQVRWSLTSVLSRIVTTG